jgi:DNA-binding GntR family transcriptional regulator
MHENSLRERAFRHIQGKILSGELAGGHRLSEQSLAEELGISRTPVRSAIHELESAGLLEQVPRYGTIVRKADRRDLEELFDLREALESFATEVAAVSITSEDVETLEALCDQMYRLLSDAQQSNQTLAEGSVLDRFVDADMEFHLIILRATGNRRLMKSVADSRMLSQWGHHARQKQRFEAMSEAWEGHRRIIDALYVRDPERSRRAMAQHIRFSKEQALKIFDRLQAEGDAAEVLRNR